MNYMDNKKIRYILEQLDRLENAFNCIANEEDKRKKDKYKNGVNDIIADIRGRIDGNSKMLSGMAWEEVNQSKKF